MVYIDVSAQCKQCALASESVGSGSSCRTKRQAYLPGFAGGRTCMKLADLGRWGGRLETRDEAKPSVGMFLSRD